MVRVAKQTGQVTEIARDLDNAWFIGVSDRALYWTAHGHQLFTCPKTGCQGDPRLLIDGVTFADMVVTTSGIYMTEVVAPSTAHRVLWLPLEGGELTVLGSSTDQAVEIAVNSSWVYLADGGRQVIHSLPMGGGPVGPFVCNTGEVTGIAADESAVYWRTGNPETALVRAGVNGGPATAIVQSADAVAGLGAIALDSTSIYVAVGGSILKVQK